MKKLHLLLCVCTLVLVGCSSSSSPSTPSANTSGLIPTEQQAREKYSKEMTTTTKGAVKVSSFKKTNGQAIESMGVKGYWVHCVAEVEMIKDYRSCDLFGNCTEYKKGDVVTLDKQSQPLFPKHGFKDRECYLTFQKTENRWE